jgi:hypothetical protein
MDLNDFENQAIPHEAGHITVGLARGFPVNGMSVIIFREQEGTLPGNFITKSIEPSNDAALLITPPPVIASYKIILGAGLAGNIVADVPAANEALQDDRRKLARVGNEGLEEMAMPAERIIRQHLEGFLKLVEAIGDRYLALKNDCSRGTGEYLLLTAQELKDLSGIDVPPMF